MGTGSTGAQPLTTALPLEVPGVGECHLYEHKYSCLFKQLFSTPKHIKTGYSQINGLQVTPQSPQNSDEV